MHVLELKIPPPAVALLMAAIMWLGRWLVPALTFRLPGRSVLALVAALAGAIISAVGVLAFRRAGTTVNPMKPDSSSSLVVSGIYARTRNPMYLGLLLILLGWAIYLSNPIAFLLLPGFMWYINRFQIEPEEKVLASRFGEKFESYASRVPRWL
jgi:protein-S-isoprenylcysteine O-methyltransferase Ste14